MLYLVFVNQIPVHNSHLLPVHINRRDMSGSSVLTVMGPGRGPVPKQDIIAPPFLTPNSDKFKRRKQVALWATTVRSFARGGDKKASGILNALGRTLFNALDTVFASKIERAITAGLISFEQDKDEEDSSNKQQKIVETIISIVAKDSPTDGVRRLVQMMREVYGCTRKNGELAGAYARRLQGLALDYLNHCDTTVAEQDSQNFAVMLL